jgi:hypothetical protein
MNYRKYCVICYREYFERFKNLPKLNLEEIEGSEEPIRKYLYAYYGYIQQLDNYTDLELSKKIEADSLSCLYEIAIKANNLKLIKYLKSRNIFYDYYFGFYTNIYYLAINYCRLKIIKYFDSNNFIFIEAPDLFKYRIVSHLEEAGNSGSLKIIKYFELKEKDSPGFKNKIINCYITAACSLKKSIRILKYIESKYHLYITNEIIYKARNKAINCSIFKNIKYLNKTNLHIKYFEQLYLLNNINYKEKNKIIKYVFSNISELYILWEDYTDIITNYIIKNKKINPISNYLIRYMAKYRLSYI